MAVGNYQVFPKVVNLAVHLIEVKEFVCVHITSREVFTDQVRGSENFAKVVVIINNLNHSKEFDIDSSLAEHSTLLRLLDVPINIFRDDAKSMHPCMAGGGCQMTVFLRQSILKLI